MLITEKILILYNGYIYVFKHYKRKMGVGFLASLTACWLIVEILKELAGFEFFKSTSLIMFLFSIFCGVVSCWPKFSSTINIPVCNSKIKIVFGDLFNCPGHKVISVNEYFDYKIGEHISTNSLHGQFIKNILGGDELKFRDAVNFSLDNIDGEIIDRKFENNVKYEIGTTAVIDVDSIKYFCCALASTDIETLKASATIEQLLEALNGLWGSVRIESNGEKVNIPLMGGGLSGIGLPIVALINTIIISFLIASKKIMVAPELVIVIPARHSKYIDINNVAQAWR